MTSTSDVDLGMKVPNYISLLFCLYDTLMACPTMIRVSTGKLNKGNSNGFIKSNFTKCPYIRSGVTLDTDRGRCHSIAVIKYLSMFQPLLFDMYF